MAITVIESKGSELYLAGAATSKIGGSGSGTIAGPASYVTAGFAADIASDFGLSSEPDCVVVSVKQVNATRTYEAIWDATNKKIVAYDAGTTTDVTATTDLSGVTFQVFWTSNEA